MDFKEKSRQIILSVIFIIICIIFIARLYDLQIINGKDYYEKSAKDIISATTIAAPRGNIYDRNGKLIAGVELFDNLKVSVMNIDDERKNRLYNDILSILVKNNEELDMEFSSYLSFNPIKFQIENKEELEKWQKDNFNLSNPILEPLEFFIYLKNKHYKIKMELDDESTYLLMAMRYEEEIKQKLNNSFTISESISMRTKAEISEKGHEMPGVWIEEVYKRKYFEAENIAHVLGYYGSISQERYEKIKDEGYSVNDLTGISGIELQAERYLRGEDGRKWLEKDADGNYLNKIIGIPAKPGNDVMLTIDMKIQEIAMKSLEENINLIKNKPNSRVNFNDANAGSVVAIDVNSGEILAMASYPTYDPSVFLSKTQYYNSDIINLLNTNKDKPQLNRAASGTYAPGSTFKPLIGIAALEEGIITRNTIINDTGKLEVGNHEFFCMEYKYYKKAHGEINIKSALETSCNIFFHTIALETGIDNISKWAGIFRLGERTGIDLPFEEKGVRPSKEYKARVFNDIWRPADTAQIGIGQLYNDYTPLQLASYVSSIANGGYYYKPHLIKSIHDKDGLLVNKINPAAEKLPVKEETIKTIKEGMVAVANSVDGTAVNVFRNFPFKVAGKTGTAETSAEGKASSNALFIAYAPAENPQIAVAVVIEKGVWGSWSAPVAKDIMEKYFEIYGDELYNKDDNQAGTLTK
jgi:penicillin-binding protein 2